MNILHIVEPAMYHLVTVNFVLSLLLLLQVLRHYIFFSKGQPSLLKKGVRRVFLADFLMAFSVLAFNVTPHITGDYVNGYIIDFPLKVLQAVSIFYAIFANYKLYKIIQEMDD